MFRNALHRRMRHSSSWRCNRSRILRAGNYAGDLRERNKRRYRRAIHRPVGFRKESFCQIASFEPDAGNLDADKVKPSALAVVKEGWDEDQNGPVEIAVDFRNCGPPHSRAL